MNKFIITEIVLLHYVAEKSTAQSILIKKKCHTY